MRAVSHILSVKSCLPDDRTFWWCSLMSNQYKCHGLRCSQSSIVASCPRLHDAKMGRVGWASTHNTAQGLMSSTDPGFSSTLALIVWRTCKRRCKKHHHLATTIAKKRDLEISQCCTFNSKAGTNEKFGRAMLKRFSHERVGEEVLMDMAVHLTKSASLGMFTGKLHFLRFLLVSSVMLQQELLTFW